MPAKQSKPQPLHVQSLESPRASLSLAGTLLWAYLLLLLLGYVVFQREGTLVRGSKLSPERAAFVVVSAGTLTGFQMNLAVDEYHAPGHWMMLALTIGGTLFALIVGGIAVARIVRLPYSDRQIVATAIVAEFLAIVLGTIALHKKDQSILVSVFDAASAFGNSGVWMGEKGTPASWNVHTVLLPMAVLGGLGLPVLLDIGAVVVRRRRLSTHSGMVLSTTATVYLLGLIAIFSLQWIDFGLRALDPANAGNQLGDIAERAHARAALSACVTVARTTQWLVILLMAIGASPGGAGGGLKTTILPVLGQGIWNIFSNQTTSRIFRIALVWIATYAILIFVPFLFLLNSEPDMDPDRLLFIVVSAASNVGLSHERISIAGGGQITLCVTMLLGRLLPLVVLWWTAMTVRDADVAVG